MNFLIDECLATEVARLLTDAGHDAVHVNEVGLMGCNDIEVMSNAVESQRVIVSADTDFGELLARRGHP